MTHPAQTALFVFGSNLAGIHGTGAALHAARWCGARRGQGEGIIGAQDDAPLPACYAIPTKRTPQEGLPLSPGTRAMIDLAKRDGLQVRVVQEISEGSKK